MPRVLRWTLVLFALILAASAVSAQPRGGGAGTPTPAPGSWIPRPVPELPELEDFDDVLENPQQALEEFQAVLSEGFNELIEENRALFEENRAVWPAAISSTITRLAALVFGLILLAFPDKTKVWAWVFAGVLIALILTQLPYGDVIKRELSSNADMRFMRNEPAGTLVMLGIGALMGLSVLTPLYFFGMMGLGALAGAAVATQLGGGMLESGLLTVGAVVGFMLTAWAVSRGALLVPLGVGAAMIVFAAGFGPTLVIPIMLGAGLVALARSSRFKQLRNREKLPTLKLQEGKVVVAKDDKPAREHLHEILPTLADDSDSPLIRR